LIALGFFILKNYYGNKMWAAWMDRYVNKFWMGWGARGRVTNSKWNIRVLPSSKFLGFVASSDTAPPTSYKIHVPSLIPRSPNPDGEQPVPQF
jgi:hypothetical protein